jgi:hypothetical protein
VVGGDLGVCKRSHTVCEFTGDAKHHLPPIAGTRWEIDAGKLRRCTTRDAAAQLACVDCSSTDQTNGWEEMLGVSAVAAFANT